MRGLLIALTLASACATAPRFHEGPSGLSDREKRALMAAGRVTPAGFARFWLRADCRVGLVKWRDDRSRLVRDAPAGLLDLVRDEVGRLNKVPQDGETVYASVTVFRWEKRWFGRPPKVGVEVVGRDRAGQIIWVGQDEIVAPRDKALSLAEGDDVVVARELGRKLLVELGR